MNARVAMAERVLPQDRPGRDCPLAYRYPPRSLARPAELRCDVLYVAGGLYGNVEALAALLALAAAERADIVFNGDFHWFDVAEEDYERVAREVLARHAIRGNVETEIAGEESGAGCGCAYPEEVSDPEVERSNEIVALLRETSRAFPDLRARQGALPMNLVAQVGRARVGIVHGDAASLAGWGFASSRLDDPAHARWVGNAFADAEVDVFASSHTCLPACRTFGTLRGPGAVINNGAAGMPNFSGESFGVVTRIAVRPAATETLYGVRIRDVHVDALPLRYDTARWMERFLACWPEGSPAHASYFRRMVEGPRHTRRLAAPPAD
jgi:hypothetical protein